jgi:hypothetical protein
MNCYYIWWKGETRWLGSSSWLSHLPPLSIGCSDVAIWMRNECLYTESIRVIYQYFESLPFDQGVQAHQSVLQPKFSGLCTRTDSSHLVEFSIDRNAIGCYGFISIHTKEIFYHELKLYILNFIKGMQYPPTGMDTNDVNCLAHQPTLIWFCLISAHAILWCLILIWQKSTQFRPD